MIIALGAGIYQQLKIKQSDKRPQQSIPLHRKDFCFPSAEALIHDGDTIKVKSSKQRIRLIGIDAPEMGQKPFGKVSKNYLIKLVQSMPEGQVCCEKGGEAKDKYGRTLAYCWVGDTFLNAEMVKNGQAVTLFYGEKNNKYKNLLLSMEETAEKEEVGIHNNENPLPESPYSWRRRMRR